MPSNYFAEALVELQSECDRVEDNDDGAVGRVDDNHDGAVGRVHDNHDADQGANGRRQLHRVHPPAERLGPRTVGRPSALLQEIFHEHGVAAPIRAPNHRETHLAQLAAARQQCVDNRQSKRAAATST